MEIAIVLVNSTDADKMWLYAAFYLGLHCLLVLKRLTITSQFKCYIVATSETIEKLSKLLVKSVYDKQNQVLMPFCKFHIK